MCTMIRFLCFMGYVDFLTHLYCLDECLRITILDTCCFGCLLCMCFIFFAFAPVQRN